MQHGEPGAFGPPRVCALSCLVGSPLYKMSDFLDPAGGTELLVLRCKIIVLKAVSTEVSEHLHGPRSQSFMTNNDFLEPKSLSYCPFKILRSTIYIFGML